MIIQLFHKHENANLNNFKNNNDIKNKVEGSFSGNTFIFN